MAATTGRGAGTVTRGVDTGALVRAKQWHSSVPRGPVENEFGDRDRQRVRDRLSGGRRASGCRLPRRWRALPRLDPGGCAPPAARTGAWRSSGMAGVAPPRGSRCSKPAGDGSSGSRGRKRRAARSSGGPAGRALDARRRPPRRERRVARDSRLREQRTARWRCSRCGRSESRPAGAGLSRRRSARARRATGRSPGRGR